MELSEIEIENLKERSRKLRLQIFDFARCFGGYHFGGALSCVEILVDLYKKILKPEDKFILSKGHSDLALYPLLVDEGYFPRITEHPDRDPENGIHATTGSLGMGLPTAVGMALARKIQDRDGRIYVLFGEAGLEEGTAWESFLIASQYRLDNLTGIFDNNEYQGSGAVEDILSLGGVEGIRKKLLAFDCNVYKVDGHSHQNLVDTLGKYIPGKPTMIIASTIKGKGAKIMEQDPGSWHGRFPTPEQMEQIYKDLGGQMYSKEQLRKIYCSLKGGREKEK